MIGKLLLPGATEIPPELKPVFRLIPAVVLLGLLAAALEGIGIGLVIPLLGVIMGENTPPAASGLTQLLQGFGAGLDTGTRLALISGAILVFVALKNLVSYANALLSAHLYGKTGHAVRSGLARRLLEVGFPFLRREDPGRLLNILSVESWRVCDAIATLLSIVISISATATLIVFLLLLSWRMTLLVVLGIAIIHTAQSKLSARLKAPSRGLTERNAELAARMLHIVQGGQLIRVFGQQKREQQAFDGTSAAVQEAGFVIRARQSALQPLNEVLYAALFLIVLAGAWASGVGFPVIVAFVVLLYRLQPYVRSAQASLGDIHSWTGSLEQVRWLLDPRDKPLPPTGDETPPALTHQIAFRGVSFGYVDGSGDEGVLRETSFSIKAGLSTALLGRSGAGKTTIVNLLFRLIEPDSGEILVDGQPLSRLDPEKWRRRLALASQDVELVDGTVLENIVYGRPEASRAEAEKAAVAAEAHEFVSLMPQGYDTPIGYRGQQLSAGQRQRIALARALVCDADLLILDEATNAVDGLSEAAILGAIHERKGRRTTIVISHHRNTIASCDEAVILRNGNVAAQVNLDVLNGLEMDDIYGYSTPPARTDVFN